MRIYKVYRKVTIVEDEAKDGASGVSPGVKAAELAASVCGPI